MAIIRLWIRPGEITSILLHFESDKRPTRRELIEVRPLALSVPPSAATGYLR